MKRTLDLYGLNSAFENILYNFSLISYSKTKDKSVLGSINEFVYQTKFYMTNWKLDHIQATTKINDLIMGEIDYDRPIDRFRKIIKI